MFQFDPEKISFRQGSMEDLDQLQKLAALAYSVFQKDLSPENWTLFNSKLQDKENFSKLLKLASCFVCLHKNEIIGSAYIIPSGNPTELFKAEWCYIRMVSVHPHYQGHGIAKTLTNKCINFAKQTNEKTIALHTSEFMPTARHIYQNLGFQILEEIPPLFGKKYWLYTLDLS